MFRFRARFLFLALLAVVLLAGQSSLAIAQDASPVASQVAAACVAPELPPGTPTPMEEPAPAATPAHDMVTTEVPGSPEAIAEIAEEASPASDPAPAGTPADPETSERAIEAVENVIVCLSTGDYLGFAALITPQYLLSSFGTTNPYDLPVFLEGFPPQELQSAKDVEFHADGRISVDVTTILGGTQVDRFRAYFVDVGGQLLLDEEVSLPVEGADVTIDVVMRDYAFDMSQVTVPVDALVAFTLTNQGQFPHEFAVVRLPEGVSVEQVLSDPGLEEQVQFIGGAFAEPGGTGYLALEGLEAGTYTAVCFVDVPEGVPHIVRGMVAEFTVE